MVEATKTLPPHPSRVVICLARLAAKEAVKQGLRDQGLKPQYMRFAEISRAATIYFEAHARELVEEAWAKCQRSAELMKLYENEQRERQRSLHKTQNICANRKAPPIGPFR